MPLELSTIDRNGFHVVAVSGDVDISAATQLRVYLLDAVTGDLKKVVVDLSNLDFMDSTGIGVLVNAMKAARERNMVFRVVAPRERIIKLFRITGLYRVLFIHGSIETAVGEQVG